MGIVRTGETQYDKELELWNKPKRLGGYGPDGFEKYPQMLYKAHRRENGKVQCMEPPPPMHLFLTMPEYHRAEAIATAFTQSCQFTVRSDDEYERARREGWRDSPTEALAFHEALEREMATAAAESNFAVQRMSERARDEHKAANLETDAHVVDVEPKRRPGRPKAQHANP